jgi:hypothetical protein
MHRICSSKPGLGTPRGIGGHSVLVDSRSTAFRPAALIDFRRQQLHRHEPVDHVSWGWSPDPHVFVCNEEDAREEQRLLVPFL